MTRTEDLMDLRKVLDDLFLVLTDKERWVVTKRFSLDNEPRWTLERIGQKFTVTRERIRQIEKIALSKLKRTAPNTRLKEVGDRALSLLNQHGGVSLEKDLVAKILEMIQSQDKGGDASIVKLALAIHPDIIKVSKTDTNYPFYHLVSVSPKDIHAVNRKALQLLEKKGDVLVESKLLADLTSVFAAEDKAYTSEFMRSALSIDRRTKKTEQGVGLMIWRHVNPKSIRDKAYLILKKSQHPLHFQQIAQKITEASFDKKRVTTQAVHNELIRYDQFVLVGRGLYALAEWGYKDGTVADVIEDLLKKKSPLSKQEITSGVLRQRKVKKGTISLNLQKNAHFVRVGRALYALDASKK